MIIQRKWMAASLSFRCIYNILISCKLLDLCVFALYYVRFNESARAPLEKGEVPAENVVDLRNIFFGESECEEKK